jgi:hypothetical protein
MGVGLAGATTAHSREVRSARIACSVMDLTQRQRLLRLGCRRKREEEGAPKPDGALDPDAASMGFDQGV